MILHEITVKVEGWWFDAAVLIKKVIHLILILITLEGKLKKK